jgi:glutathione S-transferase
MLKFYYNPISPIARRVWIALLEKNIPFESVLVNLNGDQFQPEFLAINPFHHIPAIVDDGFRVIESLAILDYLESQYPTPKLLPADPKTLATVRMIQMVSINELAPQVIALITENENSPKLAKAKQQIARVLGFFSQVLGESSYFGGDQFTLADIVAGNSVILLSKLGINLSNFPNIKNWCQRLMQREAWQKVQPNDEQVKTFKQRAKALLILRQRELERESSSNQT